MADSKFFEHFLYDIQFWAVWNVKVFGYLTLSSWRGKTLTISTVWSWSRWYPVLLTALTFLVTTFYSLGLLNEHSQGWYITAIGSTELFAFTIAGSLACFVAIAYRIHANFEASAALAFWHRTHALLELISQNVASFEKYAALFYKCRATNRRNFILAQGSAVAAIIGLNIVYPLLVDKFWWKFLSGRFPSNFEIVCNLFWGYTLMAHVAYGVWVTSFLQVYRCSIRIVGEELKTCLLGTAVGKNSSNSIAITSWNKNLEFSNEYTTTIKKECKLRSSAMSASMNAIVQVHVSDLAVRQFPAPQLLVDSKVTNCIKIYYQIEEEIQAFTKFFGNKLIVEILLHTAYILLYLFIGLAHIGTRDGDLSIQIGLGAPLIAYLVSLYNLGTSSSRLVQESDGVLSTLEELTLQKNVHFELRQKIQTLMIRISAKPPEPDPGMYFKLNRSLITAIASAITTYLVVLLQFRAADNSDSTTTLTFLARQNFTNEIPVLETDG